MAIDQATGTTNPSGGPTPPPPVLPKPKLPGVGDVAAQVYRDLFGKDVQETATFSYEWTADQFGHFALGFEITYLLSWIAALMGYKGGTVYFGLALANVLVFVVKEAFDFRRELIKAREAKSVFKFNGTEIFYNVVTALLYIAIGALVAGFALLDPLYGIIAVFASLPIALGVGYLWLRLKVTFQQAGLPYLYRLATFPNEVDKATGEFIVELSKPAPAGSPPTIADHLIIAGPLDSGKSSLAVGIGTEYAFRLGIGRYTTLAKLLQSALRQGNAWDKPEFDDGRVLWPWETSDLLIVDDVDVLSDHIPGTATDIAQERLIAQTRVNQLKSQIPAVLQAALKYRRTVWVVGDIDDGELKRWQAMIADIIGVGIERVRTFGLAQKVRELAPTRSMPPEERRVKQ